MNKPLQRLGISLIITGVLLLAIPPVGITGIIVGIMLIIRSKKEPVEKTRSSSAKSKEKSNFPKISPQVGKVTYSERTLPGLKKQLDESINIIDTTVKLDVFFSRYEFLLKTLTRIIETEKVLKNKNTKSIELFELLDKPETREEQINEFIKRSHERLLLDMSNLKTEKGRTNKAAKYFDEMNEYADKMYDSNLVLLDDLKKQSQITKAASGS